MSNKKDEPKKKGQLLPGEGALRRAIAALYSAKSMVPGQPNMYALKIGDAWHTLNALEVLQEKVEGLFNIAQASDLPMDMTKKELVELGRQIAKAAIDKAILLPSAGYQAFELDGTRHEVVVWRGEAHWIGDEPAVPVVVDSSVRVDLPPVKGSRKKWHSALGAHMLDNPTMLVALGAALSALLVGPVGIQPLMLMLVGPSSSGKTSIQQAVQSIIRPGSVKSASGTVLGLHQWMSHQPDQPVFLQETRQVTNSAELINLVFDHGNGGSRAIGNAAQRGTEGRALRCVLIASNEQTLAELVRRKSVVLDAGVDARLFELVTEGAHGAFEKLPSGMTAADFAQYLAEASQNAYGAVWGRWVAVVVENCVEIREKAAKLIPLARTKLLEQVEVNDPVFNRMLTGYAGWFFALVMAAKYGVFPIENRQIRDAFYTVLKAHSKRYASGLTPIDHAVIEAVRAAIDENPGRFTALSERGQTKGGVWGYIHKINDEILYLVFGSSLSKLASSHTDREILDALVGADYLKHNKGERMLSVRVPNEKQSKRFYAIRERICFDG